MASLLDAAAFVRRTLGGPQGARREVLLALTGGIEVHAAAVAELLARNRSSVAKELTALETHGLVERRGPRNRAQVFRLTMRGERYAAVLREALAGQAQSIGGYDTFVAAVQPRTATATGQGPSPVRMELPVAGAPRRTTAQRLKLCRQAAGLTQYQLARRAHVSLTTLQRIEGAQLDPPVYALRRCAMTLGVPLISLLHPA